MHQETYIGGVWYPSVTTILSYPPKPFLERWYEKWGKRAERKTAVAGDMGADFHSGVEAHIHGLAYSPKYRRVEKMLARWREWADSVNVGIDHTELRIVHPKTLYSGTLDAVGSLDGEPCVFDWKTSKGIKPDAELQIAAYAFAYEAMTGVKVRRGIAVNVLKKKPDHKLATREYKLDKRLFNKFLKRLEEFREAVA